MCILFDKINWSIFSTFEIIGHHWECQCSLGMMATFHTHTSTFKPWLFTSLRRNSEWRIKIDHWDLFFVMAMQGSTELRLSTSIHLLRTILSTENMYLIKRMDVVLNGICYRFILFYSIKNDKSVCSFLCQQCFRSSVWASTST